MTYITHIRAAASKWTDGHVFVKDHVQQIYDSLAIAKAANIQQQKQKEHESSNIYIFASWFRMLGAPCDSCFSQNCVLLLVGFNSYTVFFYGIPCTNNWNDDSDNDDDGSHQDTQTSWQTKIMNCPLLLSSLRSPLKLIRCGCSHFC